MWNYIGKGRLRTYWNKNMTLSGKETWNECWYRRTSSSNYLTPSINGILEWII